MKPENADTAKDWARAVDKETARILATGADLTIEEATEQAAANVSTTRKAEIAARIYEARHFCRREGSTDE